MVYDEQAGRLEDHSWQKPQALRFQSRWHESDENRLNLGVDGKKAVELSLTDFVTQIRMNRP